MTPANNNDDVSTGELMRTLQQFRTDVVGRLDGMERRFVTLDRYEADQHTAAEQRKALAETVADETKNLRDEVNEIKARRKAMAGVVASALVALIVALVAAGLTKGFGL